jgi:hypothetical protein
LIPPWGEVISPITDWQTSLSVLVLIIAVVLISLSSALSTRFSVLAL